MSPTEQVIITQALGKAIAFFHNLSAQVIQIRACIVIGFVTVLLVQILTLWLIVKRRTA